MCGKFKGTELCRMDTGKPEDGLPKDCGQLGLQNCTDGCAGRNTVGKLQKKSGSKIKWGLAEEQFKGTWKIEWESF